MSLQEKDRNFIWHPYTQEKTAGENIVIASAEGALLFDENGRRYIDACSSWWTNLHGHAHPHIAKRIADQALKLEQVIFAGFSHPPAIRLAEKLLQLLPGFSKVFYSDNGSTAVEVALKMALQYWSNRGLPRQKILCFRDAYHGDTFGAMSVSARGVFTAPYQRLLFEVIFVDTPDFQNEEAMLRHFSETVNAHAGEIAAFIFEPLVLGSSGMKMYAAESLDRLLGICSANEVITIADEVMTGFGRTGKLFAIQHLRQVPDIICLSKGITGGFLPFAATLAKQGIYDTFFATEKNKMLFHGHSYTGNPLGCAAALASLEIFEMENTPAKIAAIAEAHVAFAESMKAYRSIADIRRCGTIIALEFKDENSAGYLSGLRDKMYHYFISRGILLRPLGNVLYLMPPFCIQQTELTEIYQAVRDFAVSLG